jgi:hypothetical protein
VHGLQGYRQRRCLLEAHACWNFRRAAGVGDRIFGDGVAGRTHDAIADRKTGDALAEAFDFARTFEAENRAQAADGAMLMAGEHEKIGTIERGGLHAHPNFAGAGPRSFDGVDSRPVLIGNNDGSHSFSPLNWSSGSRRISSPFRPRGLRRHDFTAPIIYTIGQNVGAVETETFPPEGHGRSRCRLRTQARAMLEQFLEQVKEVEVKYRGEESTD